MVAVEIYSYELNQYNKRKRVPRVLWRAAENDLLNAMLRAGL